MMNSNDFKVGDRVLFGRERGEKTLGEVVKVNRVKLKIKQLDARGTMRNYPVGTIWTVPPSLAEHAGARLSFHPEREFTAPSRQPAIVIPPVPPKDVSCGRTEKEIKKEILGIYCSLSPENLSCDGELPGHLVQRRAASLHRRLRECFQELGRELSESDAYSGI